MIGYMMMNESDVRSKLDIMIPEPRCELNYTKDYELLIATVLSAQCTDVRVNMVTKKLWEKYDLSTLALAAKSDVMAIIRPVGTFNHKAGYIIAIAGKLMKECGGKVPNDREYLESLPGVGRKTCNVVLANIFNVPTLAVDTHVARVSKRLGIAKDKDKVYTIEKKLMKFFPKDKWTRLHHQLVLFGRYICKAKKLDCEHCLLKEYCLYYKKNRI